MSEIATFRSGVSSSLIDRGAAILEAMDRPESFGCCVAIISMLALITRLSVLLFFWSGWTWQQGLVHDQWNELTINLVDHGTYGFQPGEPTVLRGPTFPVMAVPLYLVFGENYAGWSIALLLFDTCTCLLLMLLGRRLWGRRAGLLAGILYSVNLAVVYYTVQISQFTVVLPFVLIWFYLFSLWDQRPFRSWLPWALGVISGVLILSKSVYLPAPLLGAAAIVWFHRSTDSMTGILRRVAVYLLITAAVVAPWTYRNFIVSEGKFIPVQNLFWSIAWQDILLSNLDRERGMARPAGETLQQILSSQADLFNAPENRVFHELYGIQKELYRETVFRRSCLEWIRANPMPYVGNVLNNSWQFWIGAENLRKIVMMAAMQIVFVGAAVIGLILLARYRQVYKVRFGLLLILMLWAEHCVVFGWGRFSLDLAPTLAMTFGLGLDAWVRHGEANLP